MNTPLFALTIGGASITPTKIAIDEHGVGGLGDDVTGDVEGRFDLPNDYFGPRHDVGFDGFVLGFEC